MGSLVPLPDIDEMALDGGSYSHGGRHEMRPAACPLSPFYVPIASGSAPFPRLKHVGIHGEAHAAAGFSPLKACLFENSIESFLFGLLRDQTGSRYHHRMDTLGHMFAVR